MRNHIKRAVFVISFVLFFFGATFSFISNYHNDANAQKGVYPIYCNEYIVVSCNSAEDLENNVNDLIKRGFQPNGGVSTMKGVFFQAMVK